MNVMTDSWTPRLSEYIDGELTSGERHAVDAHLAECGDCRRTLEALQTVVARAAAATPRPPATDLWDGIAEQIGTVPRAIDTPPGRAAWRVSFTLPQLVAATLALMVVSGGAVWVGQHGGRATSIPSLGAANGREEPAAHTTAAVMTDGQYTKAIADLEQTLQNGRSSFDPSTVDVVEQNVAVIDRAIEQARQALGQEPANIYLNNHLTDLKQQKLSVLQQVTAAMALSSR